VKNKNNKTTIIEPSKSFLTINWREILIDHRDLLYFFAKREVIVLYKQTILGFSWAILRPVISMIIFTIVFGRLAEIDSDGIPYPLFSYVALVPWTYFSSSITKSSQSLVAEATIFTKVYFPRLIIPITPVIAGLVDFFIAMLIVGLFLLYYSIIPNMNILFLPILLIIMMITASGFGMWLSALAVQYRDIRHAMQFLTQLLMYSAPVVWPASLLQSKFGEEFLYWYALYPMVGVIEGFRSCLIGNTPMPWVLIIIGLVSACFLFFTGALYFKNKENIFADVV